MGKLQPISDYSLKKYNTFGFDVLCDQYIGFKSIDELNELSYILSSSQPKLLLGQGSNLLFVHNFHGIVLHPLFSSIQIIEDNSQYVLLRLGAGELWDDVVDFASQHNYYGIENLAGIPSSVGAAPVQNIGAYGVQFQDVFFSLQAYNLETHVFKEFQKNECNFGYRTSIFKDQKEWLICFVTIKLTKKPNYQLQYPGIQDEIQKQNITHITATSLVQIIRTIRNKKLPAITELGSAGSFFKNPIISKQQYLQLKNDYPNIVAYNNNDNTYKLSAGWLIEQCGWKGTRLGNVGVYEKQALILVHYGNGTGQEILDLANNIVQSVKDKFQVILSPEVVIIQ